ncbi:unnamed protein product [Penicillium nalgiovense]|uniref:Poly [ADP-ribose] polymerase n=1 Tax=Penicillium nalgiovense TaxID=60175 RepID=A0A9W4N640_PENNA|nr:unnamed protein product [Penicillium nalgiovense]CAG8079293.1 unnamed protein product [Penicillium nalgiovense]CAG8141381.1 unnamed protein product [Penicillium nalgiovense]CAG8190364.1 unnamed protein product [Penicillium nalgiovense]CAG8192180.1 unnamed protein product [Penicillium nalgiovense]
MVSEKPVDKLADNLKGLVIGASGTIPGYQHVDQADKLGSCQIVNIDWLLQKIGKGIPKSVQRKIIKREKNADIESKGKKRARESSLGDDQGNSSKKTKDEEQIKLQSMIALYAFRLPGRRGIDMGCHIGQIWSDKAVEVSRIQLLVHGESQTFHTWDLQYKFGSSEESNSIGNAGTLDSAKRTFRAKFKSRSHLAWKDRHAIPNAKGWIFLETHPGEAPIFTSKTTPLPASVENVLKIIFTSGNLQNYLHLLHTHGRNVLVENKVDKRKLLVGIAVLGKLMDLTDPELALAPVYRSKARKRLCTIYESLILTNLILSDTKDTVRQELESLDLLLKLRDASEILEKESQSSSLAMSQISQVLGLAKMTPEVDRVQDAPGGIIGVFRLERPGEAERFTQWEKENLADIGDRRLLWHGSASSNFAGILSQGLRGDGIVSIGGKNFVSGVYFADISTKSAGYCRQRGEALILLCEVELGKSSALSVHHAGSTVHMKWRDAEYIHPDFKGFRVPDVRVGTTTAGIRSNFYHCEYVVENPAQIRQRYLFHVNVV